MEANGGGGGLEDHALPNGVGDHALPNGVGDHAWPNAALANGAGDHALPNGAPANGGGQANHALANGGGHALANGLANGVVPAQAPPNGALANPEGLRRFFLCLPAQEIARCRMVCRQWRDITGTDEFRRDHHRHRYRMPMPLLLSQAPGLARCYIHAADMRNGVRPVMGFPFHHGALRIHGSCDGILLLSCGNRLYACNPCTRRWARLPPLHVNHRIIGFYTTGVYGHPDFGCQVLYDDGQEDDCVYWVFKVDADAAARFIGRPGSVEAVGLDLVMANGIAPSYSIPPVYFLGVLWWLPQATRGTSNILMFDTFAESFSLIPPPTIQVNDEVIPAGVGAQLFEMHEHLAMTVISPTRINVWVRSNVTELWSHRYLILWPGDVINACVFAVGQERSGPLQFPYILRAYHGTILSRHTIQENLLLHPSILPLQDTDAVDGDTPFFHNLH